MSLKEFAKLKRKTKREDMNLNYNNIIVFISYVRLTIIGRFCSFIEQYANILAKKKKSGNTIALKIKLIVMTNTICILLHIPIYF